MHEGAACSALPGTTVSRAVAEDAVAVGESRSRSKSRSRFWARSRSLFESVAALWFSGEAIACLLAVTVLRELHLVASGAFIFFGGVAVAVSSVAAAVAGEGAAVAEAPAVALAAVSPVKGAAVAKAAAVALAAVAPLEGTAVTEAAASVLGFFAAVALAAAMNEAAAVGPGSEACLFCLFSQASLLSLLYCCLLALGGRLFVFFRKTVVSLQLKVTSLTPPLDSS